MPGSCMNDTNCIALNLVGGKLQASLTIDPDPTNGAICRAGGLYVPSPVTEWMTETAGWTYVSATSFTAPGDLTSRYYIGRPLRYTDGAQKYAYVVSSAYNAGTNLTTVVIISATAAGAATTLTGGAITDPGYGVKVSPYGFPWGFAYAGAYSGWAAAPGQTHSFNVVGRLCAFHFDITGTSAAGVTSIDLPFVNAGPITFARDAYATDNGTETETGTNCYINGGTATLVFQRTGGWTVTGTKRIDGQLTYFI